MTDLLAPAAFIEAARRLPVLDVRAPSEYHQGHIPGARNLPLFSDDERAEIGTTYKQDGRHAAVLRGLETVGPKMRALVGAAEETVETDKVLVHCWRGGMRSDSVAWLLGFVGFSPRRLDGGYKAYRRYVLDTFAQPWKIYVLSGRTGAGKTDVLYALRDRGQQIIDLEDLAHHKGSVFGSFGQPAAPSQQQFENELAHRLQALDPERPVWIEDESRRIGSVNVPDDLWKQMRQSDVYVLDIPRTTRINRLVRNYGAFERTQLKEAIHQIERRLGGLRTRKALAAVDEGDLHSACRLLLHYYDRAYDHGLSRRSRSPVHQLQGISSNPEQLADQLLAHVIEAS